MKTKLTLLSALAVLVMLGLPSCKKKGCTDSSALNYDSKAKKDDGSCEYEKPKDPEPDPETTHQVTDDGSGIGTTTWETGHTYILNGFCFVNNGQTLTIQKGAIVKGKPGTGASASALIVARGGKIYANGTSSDPIIMTFEGDPLDGSTPITTSGQWGGLIVLGKAVLNSTPGETQIEGIPTNEPRGLYGGNDDNDNSGSISYVSIRHGGTEIGAGNEINGLTLGAVGSATNIDHIEVVGNQDDGIECFGGKASVKYAVIAYCGDDSFDYDEGWRGFGQFWFTLQASTSDRGGEHDGGTSPEDGTPYAHPYIYNATYIGNTVSRVITLRDNAGGEYHNSIFHAFAKGIDIEDLPSGQDSKQRLDDGELKLAGIVFSDVPSNLIVDNSGLDLSGHASVSDIKSKNVAPTVITPWGDTTGTGVGLGIAPTDPWFTNVNYKGAFNPSGSSNWAYGWTKLYGYK